MNAKIIISAALNTQNNYLTAVHRKVQNCAAEWRENHPKKPVFWV